MMGAIFFPSIRLAVKTRSVRSKSLQTKGETLVTLHFKCFVLCFILPVQHLAVLTTYLQLFCLQLFFVYFSHLWFGLFLRLFVSPLISSLLSFYFYSLFLLSSLLFIFLLLFFLYLHILV